MRVPHIVLRFLAIVGLLIGSSAAMQSASAASNPTAGNGTSFNVTTKGAASTGKSASPNVTIATCSAFSQQPFQVVYKGPIYGQGQIISCNSHAVECHLVIYLEEYVPYQGTWVVVKTKDAGWGNCSPKTATTAAYTCQSTLNNYDFESETSLTMIDDLGQSGSALAYSTKLNVPCE